MSTEFIGAKSLSEPSTDEVRLRALNDTHVLDRGAEYRFDRLTRLCAQLFKVPIAYIAFLDNESPRVKSYFGELNTATGRREDSFAVRAITQARTELFYVSDALADPEYATNPFVLSAPFVRFFAAYPILSRGERVGALCLLDTEPRTFSKLEAAMLRDLAAWVESEMRVDDDRERAIAVHRALLPADLPAIDGLEVAGRCIPSRAVGGDFFDWYVNREGQLVLTVADVMGKGLGAAMVAATVRTVLKLITRGVNLSDAMVEAAHVLEEDLIRTQSFVTLIDVRIQPRTAEIEYVDAGLGLAVRVRPDGTFERLGVRGLPLGIDADAVWNTGRLQLEMNDTLVVFSDGIYDALGGTDEAFDVVAEMVSARSTLDGAIRRLIERISSEAAPDDVTIVAVRRTATTTSF